MNTQKLKTPAIAAAFVVMGLVSGSAMSAVICNTPPAGTALPIAVPQTTAGIYINFVTGAFGTAGATPGWDFNPWGSTAFNFFWSIAAGNTTVGMLTGGVHAVSAFGDPIGPGQTWSGAGTPTPAAMAPWRAGVTDGYIGIRFRNEVTAVDNYGWARLTTTGPNGIPATVTAFCYQDDGTQIFAGSTVPVGLQNFSIE